MVVDVQAPPMHLKLAGEETEIDLATLQGLWSVEQYLKLTDQTNRLIEYTDGVIEVLPMPTKYHHSGLSIRSTRRSRCLCSRAMPIRLRESFSVGSAPNQSCSTASA